jgi:hypothetical protein
MNTADLLAPILDDGIESVKFFNGRLVTAEDFERQHLAGAAKQRLGGRLLGEGVAYGFDVRAPTAKDPVLRIQAGLALSPQGDVVVLQNDVDLKLVGQVLNSASISSVSGATFKRCPQLSSGLYTAGRDAWLLTAFPAEGTRGRAPVSGLGNSTNACNAKYRVEGIQFRLVLLTNELEKALFADGKEQALRSHIAGRCFDVARATALARDPFGAPSSTCLVDVLRQRGILEPCEVPLAVFLWQAERGFRFVDRWCVRRRISAASTRNSWGDLSGDRERAASEALFYQFQEQLDDLVATDPEFVQSGESFEYLPAVGILPVAGNSRRRGFTLADFFSGFTLRPPGGSLEQAPVIDAQTVIEGVRVRALLNEALLYPPLQRGSGEMIWIYQVRENLQAALVETSSIRPYVIFARAAVPYRGHAQYDFSRWGYATYG